MNDKKCPDCRGTGHCPHCSGTGKNRFGLKCVWCSKLESEGHGKHVCSRCKGSGQV